MPKLWEKTIEAHHQTVREAILDTTAALADQHGVASITMSQIAKEAGVGRATLYKYFRDVDSILVAWHDRHVDRHLARLADVRDRSPAGVAQLRAVLEAYALIPHEREGGHHGGRQPRAHHHAERAHGRHAGDLSALVHRTQHVARAEARVTELLEGVLAGAARRGAVRRDVPLPELAQYCIHALGAAGALRSPAAVGRLVDVILAALRPRRT